MATLKQKGDLAELKVAADLLARGCSISLPSGEDPDYDLIPDFRGVLHWVQVKFRVPDGNHPRQVSLVLAGERTGPTGQAGAAAS